ncbi:MAG: hypothetical protein QXV27_06100 [Candidatus Caldarchaeum sp.]
MLEPPLLAIVILSAAGTAAILLTPRERNKRQKPTNLNIDGLDDYALLYMLHVHGKRKELVKTIKRLAGKTNDAERKAVLSKLETVVRRNA